MRDILRTVFAVLLLLTVGCVQIPDKSPGPAPPPAPGPVEPDDQFSGVDEQLVTRLLASGELRDPARLRKYAALYRGIAEATLEPELTVMQALQGGMKTTSQFVKPRSQDMQAILQSQMPKPPLSESDRQRISEAFAALGTACHAAAQRLEHGGS